MEEQSPQQAKGCCERFAVDLNGQIIVDTPTNRITAKYHCVLHQDHQPHDYIPPWSHGYMDASKVEPGHKKWSIILLATVH